MKPRRPWQRLSTVALSRPKFRSDFLEIENLRRLSSHRVWPADHKHVHGKMFWSIFPLEKKLSKLNRHKKVHINSTVFIWFSFKSKFEESIDFSGFLLSLNCLLVLNQLLFQLKQRLKKLTKTQMTRNLKQNMESEKITYIYQSNKKTLTLIEFTWFLVCMSKVTVL